MAAVFTQVGRDRVRAGTLGLEGGVQWIGIAGAPRLAHLRDMIDVDAEEDVVGEHAHIMTGNSRLSGSQHLAAHERASAEMVVDDLAHEVLALAAAARIGELPAIECDERRAVHEPRA